MKLAKCHPNRKVHAKDLCGSCYQKQLKEDNKEFHDRQKKNSKSFYAKRKGTEEYKIYQEKEKARNLARKDDPYYKRQRRNGLLKRKYNITIEQYEEMLKQQNYCCKLCFRQQGNRELHVDHDHKTNKVRGILCHQCNWYMGTIDADPSILNRLIEYKNGQTKREIGSGVSSGPSEGSRVTEQQAQAPASSSTQTVEVVRLTDRYGIGGTVTLTPADADFLRSFNKQLS